MARRLRERAWAFYAAVVVTTYAPALVVSALTDFGRHVDMQFYAAAAQIIPVLLVAIMVEAAFGYRDFPTFRDELGRLEGEVRRLEALRPEISEIVQEAIRRGVPIPELDLGPAGDPEQHKAALAKAREQLDRMTGRIQWSVTAYLFAAVAGEAACLISLAYNESSTFALMVTGTSLVLMVSLLGFSHNRRYV